MSEGRVDAAARRRRVLAAVAAVATVAFGGLWVASSTVSDGSVDESISTADRPAEVTLESRPAPAFELPPLKAGPSVAPDGFPGTVLVLNFWASWCGPCREEAPALQHVWVEYGGRGVQFLGIDHMDRRDAAIRWVTEFAITYPSGFDPEGSVAARYGLAGLPTTVIVDPQGRIRWRLLGRVDAPTLRGLLDQALSRNGSRSPSG